jgi:hypothetical protein
VSLLRAVVAQAVWLACVLLAVVAAFACTTGIGPNDAVVFPDANIRFSAHVQPFLITSCGFSGCHGESNPAGSIRLTQYSYLFFDKPNLVVPAAPDESTLVQALEGSLPHPLGLERVTSNQIMGIRRWVAEGAKNN